MAFGRTRKTSADRYAAADINAAYDDTDTLDDRLDLLEGGILAGNKTAWVVAANNAPADIKALADYVCDGVADQTEINAALATTDGRPVFLVGTFNTTAAIVFAESGTSPLRHDLIGSGTNTTVIVANHTGNAVQLHSAQQPQEWRLRIENVRITKGATLTPARGISIQNGAHIHVRDVYVDNCTKNLYGFFCNTNNFDGCHFSDGVNGIELTGASNQGSHFNVFRSCTLRANDVGILITTWASWNKFHDCTIEPTLSTDVGVRIASTATNSEGNDWIDCWVEGAGSNILDLQAGQWPLFLRCRFAIGSSQDVVKASGFGASYLAIVDPYTDSPISWEGLPAGVTVTRSQKGGTVDVTIMGADPTGVANSSVAFNRALAILGTAGGTITGPRGTYSFQRVGSINHDAMGTSYCVRVGDDTEHGPIAFSFPPGTTFKLANNQLLNSAILLLDGNSTTRRRGSTLIEGIIFDGNGVNQPAWSDHGILTVLYANEVVVRRCTFTAWAIFGVHVLRDCFGTRFENNLFWSFGLHPTSGNAALRPEVNSIVITGNRFVCDAVNGVQHLTLGTNADVQLQPRGSIVAFNEFHGGYNGSAIALTGDSICVFNTFRDICSSSGWAITVSHYYNTNGTVWDATDGIIAYNRFFNVRQGINLIGGSAVLNWSNSAGSGSTRYSAGTMRWLVANNVITKSTNFSRLQFGTLDPFPDAYPQAPNQTEVTLSVGIQEGSQTPNETGTSTGGGTSTQLRDTSKAWVVDVYKSRWVYLTGGTGGGSGLRQYREILSNTATQLTLVSAWAVTPDVTTTYVISDAVGGNVIKDNLIVPTSNSTRGIKIDSPHPDTVVEDNTITPGTTSPITLAFPSMTKARRNTGFATENAGTATVASGATSIAVLHGLGITPSIEHLRLTPTNDPTNDVGNFWVSSPTSTQFTINVGADPGSGGATFAWRAAVI